MRSSAPKYTDFRVFWRTFLVEGALTNIPREVGPIDLCSRGPASSRWVCLICVFQEVIKICRFPCSLVYCLGRRCLDKHSMGGCWIDMCNNTEVIRPLRTGIQDASGRSAPATSRIRSCAHQRSDGTSEGICMIAYLFRHFRRML